MAEPERGDLRRRAAGCPRARLHESLHERQVRDRLSDRGAVGRRLDADRHRLAREGPGVLENELVGERVLAQRFREASQRLFVGNDEGYDDGRRVSRRLGRGVGRLGNLHPMGEIASHDGVEDLQGACRRIRRLRGNAFALTVDATWS